MIAKKVRQEFKALSFVSVRKYDNSVNPIGHNGCIWWEDVPKVRNFDGIIRGSYSELCGGDDVSSYDIFIVEDGKVTNGMAWFDDKQITLLPDQDDEKAMEMIGDYYCRPEKKNVVTYTAKDFTSSPESKKKGITLDAVMRKLADEVDEAIITKYEETLREEG